VATLHCAPLTHTATPAAQVLVVRCDLDMGVGKIGAQCGHAAVGAYKRLVQNGHKPLVAMWEKGGAAKIVVRCRNQEELMELEDAAGLQRLPTYKVSDAGHTQVSFVTLRAPWVTLRAPWVTLRARWVTLRARWVTLRAR
jgi:peptidyl-tRNA hydrolase